MVWQNFGKRRAGAGPMYARTANPAASNSHDDESLDSDDREFLAEFASSVSSSDSEPTPSSRTARRRRRHRISEAAAANAAANAAAAADEAAAADGDGANDADAPATPPLARRRARRPQRRYFLEDAEVDESESEADSSPLPPTPEADSWHSPEPIAPPTRKQWLPVESAAAALLRPLAGIESLAALAAMSERFDVDGYSAVFRGEGQLDALAEAFGGERVAINPLGMEYAHARGLYNTNHFCIVGLSSPHERMGAGLCLEQNRCGACTASTFPPHLFSLSLSATAHTPTSTLLPLDRHGWLPS